MEKSVRLLIVEDETALRSVLTRELEHRGFAVTSTGDPEEGLKNALSGEPDVLLLDLKLPGLSGTDLLRRYRDAGGTAEVVMLTGHGSLETAVDSMRLGAYDFLTKPCPLLHLEAVLRKACEKRLMASRMRGLKRRLLVTAPPEELIHRSAVVAELLRSADTVAATDACVLLLGESGTGKELLARRIHRESPRGDESLVVLNSAALTDELMESELFGHVRGAFTGATADRTGLFETADGGTLFLDEVAELGARVQAKLLRTIQFGEVRRVGGTETMRVNVRVIAATNKDLAGEVKAGRFREDLFYRLNIFPILIPPLRNRPEDIPALVEHFLSRSGRPGRRATSIHPSALEALVRHSWPGNVRELENAVERLAVLAAGPEIRVSDLAAAFPGAGAGVAPGDEPGPTASMADLERFHIERALRAHGGDKRATARSLGIALRTLYNKLKLYGLA